MPLKAEKRLFEYAVVRYVPRVEREEFINIGLIMMCKRSRWLRVKIELDPGRMAVFNNELSVDEIERQVEAFRAVAEGNRAAGTMAELPVEERFRWLSAVRSACLQTSRPHPGLSTDLDRTFERLYAELVQV